MKRPANTPARRAAVLLASIPVLGLAPVLAGAPSRAAAQAGERDYDELLAAYKKEALGWRRARRQARKAPDVDGQKPLPPHPIHAFYPRFEELAARGDGQALLWLGLNVEDLELPAEEIAARKRELLPRFVRDFGDREWASDLVREIYGQDEWLSNEEVVGLLQGIVERNRDDDLRSTAAYKLGVQHEAQGTEKGFELAATWYRRVIDDYPETKAARKAKDRLAGLALAVGRMAPDFEARDVDGASFKLSDYRGKVVVLDFWGFW